MASDGSRLWVDSMEEEDDMIIAAGRSYNTTVAHGNSRVIQGDVVHHHHYPSVNNPSQKLTSATTQWQESNRYDLLKESLRFARMNARSANIDAAADQTCTWLLSNEAFRNWIKDESIHVRDDVLWIKGKPGTGKSTIVKFLLEHTIKQQQEAVTISYFFNGRALSELEKSSQGLYRSLTYQLLTSIPAATTPFATRFRSKASSDGVDEWTSAELQEFIIDVLENVDRPAVSMFIDALDEGSENDVRRMVGFLEKLVARCRSCPQRLRICVSSRHFPNITIKHGQQIFLDEQPQHTEDIKTFIRDNLHGELESLHYEVCVKSAGIFLWTVLVVPMLNAENDHGADIDAIKALLEELPTDLNELFGDILSSTSVGIKDCVTLLQWILFADEPLTPQELFVALHYSQASPPSAIANVPDDARVHKYLLHRSRGLIEVVKVENRQIIQFIHETVRTFLLGHDGICKLEVGLKENLEGLSHEMLKRACITFIEENAGGYQIVLQQIQNPVHQYLYEATGQRFWPGFTHGVDGYGKLAPFAQYALKLFLHAEVAQRSGVHQDEWLRSMSHNASLQLWAQSVIFIEFTAVAHRSPVKPISLIAIVSHLGLNSLLERLIEMQRTGYLGDHESINSAVAIAFANADVELIKILLGSLPSLSLDTMSRRIALDALLQRGVYIMPAGLRTIEILRFPVIIQELKNRVSSWSRFPVDSSDLLLLGADTDILDRNRTSMFSAGREGHDRSFAAILAGSAPENASTTFLEECSHGHSASNIEALINTGIALPCGETIWRSGLLKACDNPHTSDIAILLLHKVKEMSGDEGLWNECLHAASATGNSDLVQALIEAGAIANSKNVEDLCAIELACRNGNNHATLKHLVKAGAHVPASCWTQRRLVETYSGLLESAKYDEREELLKQLSEQYSIDEWKAALEGAIAFGKLTFFSFLCALRTLPPPSGLHLKTDNFYCDDWKRARVTRQRLLLSQPDDLITVEETGKFRDDEILELNHGLHGLSEEEIEARTQKFRSQALKVDELDGYRGMRYTTMLRLPPFSEGPWRERRGEHDDSKD